LLACLLACLLARRRKFLGRKQSLQGATRPQVQPIPRNLPLLGAANGALLLVQSSAGSRSSFLILVCHWEEWLCLVRFASSLFLAPRHIPAGYLSKWCAIPEAPVYAGGTATASPLQVSPSKTGLIFEPIETCEGATARPSEAPQLPASDTQLVASSTSRLQ
jgi:hypothetical protein